MKYRITYLVLILFIAVYACKKDKPINPGDENGGMVEMTEYQLSVPTHFPQPVVPEDNKLYYERIDLGKKLFFDDRLSNDGSSCDDCHKPEYGFSINGLSTFEKDKLQTSPSLVNLAWRKRFMWDGRIVGTLEDVMMTELTVRFDTDIDKFNNIYEYKTMFKNFYGVNTITLDVMAKALAQYMRVLVSGDTKFDRFLKGAERLTPVEEAGRAIFFSEKGDCFHCHTILLFTDDSLHNNGLDSVYAKDADLGYYNVTKDPKDKGVFRTPNLRNVALRTHYMHDGRFTTLEDVVEFYNTGVNKVPNVDILMTKPNRHDVLGLGLNTAEKQQLIAFLKTLTDSTMINNPMFRE